MSMDSSEMLSSLLSDPQKMNQLLETATSFLKESSPPGKNSEQAPAENGPPAGKVKSKPPATEAASFPAKKKENNTTYPAGDFIQKIMPVLTAMNQSGQKAVNQERWDLLQALKPFVASDVSRQMERAVRLISIARMTKTAMLELGANHTSST